MAPRKTWVSVAIALASIVGLLAVVIIGSAVTFFFRQVKTEVVVPDRAASEFENARARFAGQQPLIKYRGFSETPIVSRAESARAQPMVALHVLAYDSRTRKLRRVDIPATLLRLMTVGGKIRVMNLGMFGDDRDRITLDDLERRGPGLVLDERIAIASEFSRVLVWTE